MFFNFKKSKVVPDRVMVYDDSHKSVKRELPHNCLKNFLDDVVAAHPNSAAQLWSISKMLTPDLTKGVILSHVKGIQKIYLRVSAQQDFNLELQINLREGVSLEIVDEICDLLVGQREVVSVVEQEEVVAPSVESPQDIVLEVEEEDLEVYEDPRMQEGRFWEQSEDDVFGLAGEPHPEDAKGHDLKIGVEDLPWLNPGDAVFSPRRGPCRIKKVEDDARQILVKNEDGTLLMIGFPEVLAEFEFDDQEV